MEKIILIKYGELTTKKDNRNFFISQLYQNVKEHLAEYDVKITKNRVRMFVEPKSSNIDEIVSVLQNVFGIHSIVVCYKVNTNTEEIKKNVLEIVSDLDFKTFKVETKRTDKSFPIPSMEFNGLLGGLILEKKNVSVDVHNPEYRLKVEIRHDFTYIYAKEYPGLGGYPVGVAGKGLLMLSGGIDSPVAGYLSIKRGIEIECIYFESPPHTKEQAKIKVEDLVNKLNNYQSNIKLHIVNFTNIQEAIYKNIDNTYMITIMRRMMYRISEKVMEKNKCLILINGENISQVASQTLNSMKVINAVTNVPIIRPIACFDKLETIEIAKKIDTYETSILPYEDCCTIFLPKHPVINPKIEKAILFEKSFDYETLIEEAVNNIKTIKINKNYKKFDI